MAKYKPHIKLKKVQAPSQVNTKAFDKATKKLSKAAKKKAKKQQKAIANQAKNKAQAQKRKEREVAKARRQSNITPEMRATQKRLNQEFAEGKKSVSQSIDKLPEVRQLDKSKPLENINNTMNYIRNNDKLNADFELGQKIKNIMDLLTGDGTTRYKAGKDYGDFEIDSTWDGKMSHIVGHVTFKGLGTDPDIAEYMNDIAESKWGDEERHEQYLDKSARSRWDKITNKEDFKGLDKQALELIEQIMNSSEMWNMITDEVKSTAKNKSYSSSQVEDAWQDMTKDLSDTLKAGYKSKKLKRGDIEELKRLIRNYGVTDSNGNYIDFDFIKKYVNDKLSEYKG